MQVFHVQSTNWRIASLVYHTGSETKKKIKQTDEHSKSENGWFDGRIQTTFLCLISFKKREECILVFNILFK